jgi:hypothetical protein
VVDIFVAPRTKDFTGSFGSITSVTSLSKGRVFSVELEEMGSSKR